MVAKKEKSIEARLRTHFPLYFSMDFDFCFSNLSWPIAMEAAAPNELKRRVMAAALSYQMMNKSIDYTLKRYVGDQAYEDGDGDRLDVRICDAIHDKCDQFSDYVVLTSYAKEKPSSAAIAEWTLLRIPFSIRLMLSCANRGAFFEVCALARATLEQLAWSIGCHAADERDEITGISATKSIGLLKRSVPPAGRLYGWLTDHAHWEPAVHSKAFHFQRGKVGSLFASTLFKVKSLLLVGLLQKCAHAAAVKCLQEDFEKIISSFSSGDTDSNFLEVLSDLGSYSREVKRRGMAEGPFDQLFGANSPAWTSDDLGAVKSGILDFSNLNNLFQSGVISGCQDKDVAWLLELFEAID